MNPIFMLLLVMLLPAPAPEPNVGLVTLLEGPLRVIRNTELLGAVEGMGLRQGDILESGDKGFVQMEFAGGAIVALGPSTRLYLLRVPRSGSGKTGGATELVLLNGWLKGESNNASLLYESPSVAASASTGTVIVHRDDDGCSVFVESGTAILSGVSPDGTLRQPQPGKAGQFFSCRADKTLGSVPRPTAQFVESLPRAFRDTLPPRAAHFGGKSIEPKVVHAVSYTEVKSWLTMPAGWRRGLASRFKPRLRDPEFRREIEAHVSQSPEWRQILSPDKNSSNDPTAAPPGSENPQPRP